MPGSRAQRPTRRRALLLGVAVLLTASALLAVAILLIGRFGTLEGRILGTTALMGAFGILALPAAMLLDQRRARHLAGALLALCGLGGVLFIVLIWQDDPPQELGKSAVTVTAIAVALFQAAALVARRRDFEPPFARVLFVASVALATAATAVLSYLVWSDAGDGLAPRVLGALVVLDLLAAALQPILARARAAGVRVRMRITVAPGMSEEVSAEGRDLAAAVAAGIRRAEGAGGRVVAVELLERAAVPPG